MCHAIPHYVLRVQSDRLHAIMTHVTHWTSRRPTRVRSEAPAHNGYPIDLACDPAQALDQGKGSLQALATSIVTISSQPPLQSRKAPCLTHFMRSALLSSTVRKDVPCGRYSSREQVDRNLRP